MVPTAVALLFASNTHLNALSEERVRHELRPVLLDADDLFGPNARKFGTPFLIDSGERCHDGLLAILDKVERKKLRIGKDVYMDNVFTVLTHQKCDRSRFLKYAEKYALTSRNETKLSEGARRDAIRLLGQIGQPEHVEKLIPLLQEKEESARQQALTAIRSLGDRRHAQLVLDQLGAPRPNLPPLTNAEREEIIAVWKHLKTVSPPDSSSK